MKLKTFEQTHIFPLREAKGVFQQVMFWMRFATEDVSQSDVTVEQGDEDGKLVVSFVLPGPPKLIESMVSVVNYVEISLDAALKVRNAKGVCVAAEHQGSVPPKRCFLRAKEQPLEKELPRNTVLWHSDEEDPNQIHALFCDLKYPT